NPGRCLPPLLPLLPGQSGAVAVVHRGRVDAVLVLAGIALPLPLIVRAPSAAPSVSSSSTGGPAWSCVHSPLKLLRHESQSYACRAMVRALNPVARTAHLACAIPNLLACGLRLDTP